MMIGIVVNAVALQHGTPDRVSRPTPPPGASSRPPSAPARSPPRPPRRRSRGARAGADARRARRRRRNPATPIANFLRAQGPDKRALTLAAQEALAKLGFAVKPTGALDAATRKARWPSTRNPGICRRRPKSPPRSCKSLTAAAAGGVTLRLRTDIWVAAYMRTIEVGGGFATLRRRGAARGRGGVRRPRLSRRPRRLVRAGAERRGLGERRFVRAHKAEWVDSAEISARLAREIRRDPDIWIVDVERRDGAHGLDRRRG